MLRRCSDPATLSHPLLIAVRDWDKWTKAGELGAYYRARALEAAVTHPHACEDDEVDIHRQLVDIKASLTVLCSESC